MQYELCSAQVLWAVFNSWLICNKQTIKESKGHMCHGFACISQYFVLIVILPFV